MKKILFLPLLTLLFAPALSIASVSTWQKGASIVPKSPTDFSSANFQQSVRNLGGTGANTVTLIIPYYQSNLYATDIQRGWNTPTDDSLVSAINFVRSLGLKVNLKPHLDSYTGEWRALINPGDRDTWFANYESMLLHYGEIGAVHKVQSITIGAELINMASGTINPDNTSRWQKMIADLRKIYQGRLTYSSNWGSGGFATETNQIHFWPELNYIGISAYYELPSPTNSVEDIKAAWENWNTNNILPLYQAHQKPILITEIGYRSASGARYQPWNFWPSGNYDPLEQANLFEAFFSYWDTRNYVIGVDIWDWNSDPNAGGEGDLNYTPQRKPAEQTIINWFRKNPSPPTQTAQPGTRHSDGTLVKNGSAIYLITGNERRPFRDPEEFLSYGFRFSQAVTANSADMALFEGLPLKAMDGTLVLNSADNRTIYVIGSNGTRRGFVSEDVFRSLGYSFSQARRINLSDYPLGDPVTSALEAHPNGTLVKDGQTIWWINQGKRYGFPSWNVFTSYGWPMSKVLQANSADLALPAGGILKTRNEAFAEGRWLI